MEELLSQELLPAWSSRPWENHLHWLKGGKHRSDIKEVQKELMWLQF